MTNIVILSSGSGSSSRKLLENIKNMKSNVSVIITNKADVKNNRYRKTIQNIFIYLPFLKKIYQMSLMTHNY